MVPLGKNISRVPVAAVRVGGAGSKPLLSASAAKLVVKLLPALAQLTPSAE